MNCNVGKYIQNLEKNEKKRDSLGKSRRRLTVIVNVTARYKVWLNLFQVSKCSCTLLIHDRCFPNISSRRLLLHGLLILHLKCVILLSVLYLNCLTTKCVKLSTERAELRCVKFIFFKSIFSAIWTSSAVFYQLGSVLNPTRKCDFR
jgi:hypothetical protein